MKKTEIALITTLVGSITIAVIMVTSFMQGNYTPAIACFACMVVFGWIVATLLGDKGVTREYTCNVRETAAKVIGFILILSLPAMGQAQTAVKMDKNGNYIAAIDTTTTGKPTGKTYTDAKGVTYPVYVSVNGKLYVNRISKAGNPYKQYLKL